MIRWRAVALVLVVVVGVQSFGQQGEPVHLHSEEGSGFQIVERQEGRIKIINRLSKMLLTEEQTPLGVFRVINARGYQSSYRKGYPDLPLKSRLIEIPRGSRVEIAITGYDEEIISLNRHGNYRKIIPAQPSRPKQDKDNPSFYFMITLCN